MGAGPWRVDGGGVRGEMKGHRALERGTEVRVEGQRWQQGLGMVRLAGEGQEPCQLLR